MTDTSIFSLEIEDHNIAERMAYIDYKLQFTGTINRSDLKATFGLAEASASKMMTKYSEFRPHNMQYNARARVNEIIRDSFSPLLKLSAETALGMLANGFNKNKINNRPELPYVRVGNISNLDIENVEKITRAMAMGHAIKCNYFSESSSNHAPRILLPLSLLFDGRHWIFRAFYRRDDGEGFFRNFNFSRALNVVEEQNNLRQPSEELALDREWTTQVPLLLVPHESLSDEGKKTLSADFGLTENKIIVTERAALIWLLKKQWSIDDRSDEDIKKDSCSGQFNFRLTNQDMVEAVLNTLKAS